MHVWTCDMFYTDQDVASTTTLSLSALCWRQVIPKFSRAENPLSLAVAGRWQLARQLR